MAYISTWFLANFAKNIQHWCTFYIFIVVHINKPHCLKIMHFVYTSCISYIHLSTSGKLSLLHSKDKTFMSVRTCIAKQHYAHK